ncbi:glycosyltransferase family 4 protein [Candidatus Uhrbacteria bacterium]|nr:glycosyltransferase family 4 protein [Candidatus Uhrbacteria bacterium]
MTTNGFAEYHPTAKNFKKVLCRIPWYGWREQVFLPKLIASYNCDLVHFPHFNVPVLYRGKFVVTIHDFILYDFPTTRATTRSALTFWAKYSAYRFVFWNAIQLAQHVFVPSEYVRGRLQYHYPSIGDSKVTVTREGAQNTKVPFVATKGTFVESYILTVGSAYPHKNLEALIQAFLTLKRSDIHLVVVGKKDYFMRRLENCTKSDFVQFLGGVGDDDLQELYAHAKAVAVVSCEEGFGLPGVEALRYGTPVVASDRSSLPEVYRDRALYVNPYNVKDIIRVLREVLNNSTQPPLTLRGGEEGLEWKKLAEATKAVYESTA